MRAQEAWIKANPSIGVPLANPSRIDGLRIRAVEMIHQRPLDGSYQLFLGLKNVCELNQHNSQVLCRYCFYMGCHFAKNYFLKQRAYQ